MTNPVECSRLDSLCMRRSSRSGCRAERHSSHSPLLTRSRPVQLLSFGCFLATSSETGLSFDMDIKGADETDLDLQPPVSQHIRSGSFSMDHLSNSGLISGFVETRRHHIQGVCEQAEKCLISELSCTTWSSFPWRYYAVLCFRRANHF